MSGVIIAVVGGLCSGVLGAIIVGLFQRRKTAADARKSEAEANEQIRITVMSLIDPLRNRISELEKRVSKLEGRAARYLKRIMYLMDGIRRLICQLEQAKLDPEWQPDDDWQPDQED
jgi:hypothetical protein